MLTKVLKEAMIQNTIARFEGEYAFLSNFYNVYGKTVEHFYQAEKTADPGRRAFILDASSPAEAKKRGRNTPLRNGWDAMKVDVMRDLLAWKFSFPILSEKLLATENSILIEGNWWGDKFWGMCDGVGENHLGKLLMDLRGQLREYANDKGRIS